MNSEEDTFEALKRPFTQDEKSFGRGKWVYCSQHLRPHTTGWCSVSNSDKIPLIAESMGEAYIECARMQLHIYKE